MQVRELQESLALVDKKWAELHGCVREYRDTLAETSRFYKLVEEVEVWTETKTETINRLVEEKKECGEAQAAEAIERRIDDNMEEVMQLVLFVFLVAIAGFKPYEIQTFIPGTCRVPET